MDSGAGAINSSSFSQKLKLGAGMALVVVHRGLLAARLRRRADGWRHAAGLVLRGEAATFVLSAFNLEIGGADGPAEKHVAERLENFLSGELSIRIRVRRGEVHSRCERCEKANYTLCFEPARDGAERFVRPDHWREPGASTLPAGEELLNFVGRIQADGGLDLWMRVNHVGIDGALAQEVLNRLAAAWGRHGPVIFPTPEEFDGRQIPRPFAGRDDLAEIVDFVDFTPLVKWRTKANASLPAPMTISAAIMWQLAHHEYFRKIWFGTTAELPASGDLGRGVAIIAVHPADYIGRRNGLADYVRDFNRQLDLTRQRRTAPCKTLDAAAHLPLTIELALLLKTLNQGGRAFGSMGLTILRDAEVFGAPLADAGHADGFIAIGSIALNAGNGRRVGCVMMKGRKERIVGHPKAFREAIAACGASAAGEM